MPKNWVALFGTALGLVSARGESEGGFPVPDEHPSELRVVAGERHGDDAGRSVRGRRAAVPVPAAPQAHPLQLGPQHQHGHVGPSVIASEEVVSSKEDGVAVVG